MLTNQYLFYATLLTGPLLQGEDPVRTQWGPIFVRSLTVWEASHYSHLDHLSFPVQSQWILPPLLPTGSGSFPLVLHRSTEHGDPDERKKVLKGDMLHSTSSPKRLHQQYKLVNNWTEQERENLKQGWAREPRVAMLQNLNTLVRRVLKTNNVLNNAPCRKCPCLEAVVWYYASNFS